MLAMCLYRANPYDVVPVFLQMNRVCARCSQRCIVTSLQVKHIDTLYSGEVKGSREVVALACYHRQAGFLLVWCTAR